MSMAPSLSPDAMRLLKTLEETSRARKDFVRGGEIMRILGLDRPEFAKLVQELASKNLLSVAGPSSDDKIDFAILSVHPANRGFVRSL
jgi:hypothetical protein